MCSLVLIYLYPSISQSIELWLWLGHGIPLCHIIMDGNRPTSALRWNYFHMYLSICSNLKSLVRLDRYSIPKHLKQYKSTGVGDKWFRGFRIVAKFLFMCISSKIKLKSYVMQYKWNSQGWDGDQWHTTPLIIKERSSHCSLYREII